MNNIPAIQEFTMFQVTPLPRSEQTHFGVDSRDPIRGLAVALVDEVECGLIACDVHGSLRYANRSAREEMASARAVHLVGDVVRCTTGSSKELHDALNEAAVRSRRQLITLGRGANSVMATIVPLRAEDVLQSSVLIMLGRRGPCSALGLEMLAKAHGLTLAETRVLGGLLADEAPREIAAVNGVALSTIRTQIKSIREKMGVRNTEGLLIRAAEVPPVTTAWRRLGGSIWNGAISALDREPALAAA
jgi:DNA-binding CsgD family transcriptional regulator